MQSTNLLCGHYCLPVHDISTHFSYGRCSQTLVVSLVCFSHWSLNLVSGRLDNFITCCNIYGENDDDDEEDDDSNTCNNNNNDNNNSNNIL